MNFISHLLSDRIENLSIFIAIIIATIILGRVASFAFRHFMMSRSNSTENELTNYKFLGNAMTAIIYTIGTIVAIREYTPLRSFAGSLLTGAGILAAIIGLASQQAFSNIVSGIFLVMFKPFRVSDRLRIKDLYTGIVEDITLRHTVIRDFENRRVIVPNSVMANEIIVNANYEDDSVCKFVEIGISLDADFVRAKEIIMEEIGKHRFFYDKRSAEDIAANVPKVVVRVIKITDWALVLRGNAWAHNAPNGFVMYCDLLESIKIRFDEAGIPFPRPIVISARKTSDIFNEDI